jgi:hypothetical protein
MAGREMGAWRAAVPGAARVADEAHGAEGVLRLLLMKTSNLCWNARAGPISCIAISSAWESPKPPDGKTMGGRWAKRESKRFRNE